MGRERGFTVARIRGKKRKANFRVKKGRVKLCVCVCCHSNLSMNSLARVFPNRARPPTDRKKDGVTERRERGGASRCRNVSKTKKAETNIGPVS